MTWGVGRSIGIVGALILGSGGAAREAGVVRAGGGGGRFGGTGACEGGGIGGTAGVSGAFTTSWRISTFGFCASTGADCGERGGGKGGGESVVRCDRGCSVRNADTGSAGFSIGPASTDTGAGVVTAAVFPFLAVGDFARRNSGLVFSVCCTTATSASDKKGFSIVATIFSSTAAVRVISGTWPDIIRIGMCAVRSFSSKRRATSSPLKSGRL